VFFRGSESVDHARVERCPFEGHHCEIQNFQDLRSRGLDCFDWMNGSSPAELDASG